MTECVVVCYSCIKCREILRCRRSKNRSILLLKKLLQSYGLILKQYGVWQDEEKYQESYNLAIIGEYRDLSFTRQGTNPIQIAERNLAPA